jgi:hypothetical protein
MSREFAGGFHYLKAVGCWGREERSERKQLANAIGGRVTTKRIQNEQIAICKNRSGLNKFEMKIEQLNSGRVSTTTWCSDRMILMCQLLPLCRIVVRFMLYKMAKVC